MKRLMFVALALLATPAMAEDVSVRTFCQMLPQHVPADNVAYQPGVDVRGRAVAPADINKVVKDDFDAVDIPVEYNVVSSLGGLPAGSQAQPLVAMVRIYKDGRVHYNGNDLTAQAQTLCSTQSRATIVSSAEAQGQGPYYPNREPKVLGQINADGTPVRP
jgi:hypothetical protein